MFSLLATSQKKLLFSMAIGEYGEILFAMLMAELTCNPKPTVKAPLFTSLSYLTELYRIIQ
jgi:hypothetical protein